MSLPPPLPPLLPLDLPPAQHSYRVLVIPLLAVLFGMGLLALIARFEGIWLAEQPWARAVLFPARQFELPEAVRVWTRQVPREMEETLKDPLSESLRRLEGLENAEEVVRFAQMEHVIALELPPEAFQEVLSEGRLPTAGSREVLGGPLTRFKEFTLDGEQFTVVGWLLPTASGLLTGYVLPVDEGVSAHFSEHPEATQGTWVREGLPRLAELLDGQEETELDQLEVWGGQVPTRRAYTWGTIAALALIAAGGSVAHKRLFALLASRAPEVFEGILQELLRLPQLLLGMHVVLYGVFLGSMVLSVDALLLNYWMTQYIGHAFQEGSLSYIGNAYGDGNIPLAALATFYNNYVVQTLQFTFLISVFPIPLGVLKTVLSFVIVGFAMSPVWAGTASGLVFHCITMILELEAYIVACFAVTAWCMRLFKLAVQGPEMAEFLTAVRMFVGAMVLTGVMLGIAALYEAVTLILLRPLV